jgi:hypothetical protein
MTYPPLYLIFAGNLGLVWNGHNEKEALRRYEEWCEKSNDVILMRDEETIFGQA